MKRTLLLFLATFISVLFIGCKNKHVDDGVSNRLRVDLKYACPLKILSTSTYDSKFCISFDGGDSYADESTKKWHGHGPHITFTFAKIPESLYKGEIPIGTFVVKKDLTEVQYSEDYNNEGLNYNPLLFIEEGTLTVNYTKDGLYEFDFTGSDTNKSVVVLQYRGKVNYKFDYRNNN